MNKKLIEIRNQEMMCREHALLESERKDFWLAKAEEWGRRALDGGQWRSLHRCYENNIQ